MKREDRVKIYNRLFKICFFALFITFITLYFSQVTGYYEFDQHKKATLTAEEIKRFEKDVAEGKNIDLESYLTTDKKDYNNKTSSFGLKLSEGLGKIIKKGVEEFFTTIGSIVEE